MISTQEATNLVTVAVCSTAPAHQAGGATVRAWRAFPGTRGAADVFLCCIPPSSIVLNNVNTSPSQDQASK